MSEENMNRSRKGMSKTEVQKLPIEIADYYRIITEKVKDVIWTTDLDLNFLFVSDSVENLLGYSPDEALTKQIIDIMPPESQKIVAERLADALAIKDTESQDDPIGFEIELQRKDGSLVWVEVSNTFLRDADGTINSILGVARDITERREVEDALRASETQYRTLVEDSVEGILVSVTNPLQFVFVNPALAEMLGYSVDEMLSMNPTQVQEVIHPKDREGFFLGFQDRLLGKPHSRRNTVRALRKDGTVLWVELSASAIDYNGIPAIQGTFIDINEQKMTEELLQYSEERYRTVLNSMHDLIFVYDKNDCYSQVYTNDDHLLLAPVEELIGKSVSEFMPPNMLETYLEYAERIRKTGGSLVYDYQIMHNGKSLWYTSTMSLHEDGESIVSVARDITDRKIIELKLQESEEKFRRMAQTTPAAVFVRLESKFVYANETAARISGYSLKELIGINVSKLVHPDQHAMVQELMNSRDQGHKDTFHFELKLVTKSGEIRWLDYWSSLIEYDGQNASVATAIDITEKKLVDDALRTSQALLAEAQRIAHLGSWDWDVINDVDIWSEETCRIFGVDYEDFTPSYEKFLQLIHPEDRDRVRKAIQEALNEGISYSIDHRIVRPDGTIRTVHEAGEVTYDEKGRPSRMLGTILDITDRIEAEELQKKSELMYRTFVQNFQGIAYQRHLDHYGPLFFHGTVEEITGHTAEDFVDGKVKLTDIVDEESLNDVIQEINNLRSIDGYVADAEYKIRTKDGSVRWIRDTAQAVQFGKDEEPVIQGVIIDITARKLAERSTQEARTRAEFFNDLMAHDLNNIHQGLMAALELLLTDSDLPSTVTELAENALSQVERSITLIRSVRKFSSIQSDLQPTRSMDIFDTYKDALDSIRHTFSKRTIEINTILAPRKFRVMANDLLFDVFFNIFHNSVKFDTNGTVRLDITAKYLDDENAILIRIDDRGPGIIPSMKSSVLDRLERTASTSSGIGLTLVKTIIEKFGGTIWIEDRVPGDISQGSSFVFKIPRG
ncbi:MAG: PAS domain S-box protein [Candidatus Thorarchaeota archaeon]|nr:PAS domain S-box protein [Candidatus Thorarchaeota archaeon]